MHPSAWGHQVQSVGVAWLAASIQRSRFLVELVFDVISSLVEARRVNGWLWIELKLAADASVGNILLRTVCLLALTLAIWSSFYFLNTVVIDFKVGLNDAASRNACYELFRCIGRKSLAIMNIFCHVIVILQCLIIIDFWRRYFTLSLFFHWSLNILR